VGAAVHVLYVRSVRLVHVWYVCSTCASLFELGMHKWPRRRHMYAEPAGHGVLMLCLLHSCCMRYSHPVLVCICVPCAMCCFRLDEQALPVLNAMQQHDTDGVMWRRHVIATMITGAHVSC
jgi:hypothetical protein